jgi:hypothetical protein
MDFSMADCLIGRRQARWDARRLMAQNVAAMAGNDVLNRKAEVAMQVARLQLRGFSAGMAVGLEQ